MSTRAAAVLILLLVATPALAACGGKRAEGSAAAVTATPTPTPTQDSGVPSADDLSRGRSVFKLKVLGTGGTDNGPSLFVANEETGDGATGSRSISRAGAGSSRMRSTASGSP